VRGAQGSGASAGGRASAKPPRSGVSEGAPPSPAGSVHGARRGAARGGGGWSSRGASREG
jgi:hypothetical protein